MKNTIQIHHALKEIVEQLGDINHKQRKVENTLAWVKAMVKDIEKRLPKSSPEWLLSSIKELQENL